MELSKFRTGAYFQRSDSHGLEEILTSVTIFLIKWTACAPFSIIPFDFASPGCKPKETSESSTSLVTTQPEPEVHCSWLPTGLLELILSILPEPDVQGQHVSSLKSATVGVFALTTTQHYG